MLLKEILRLIPWLKKIHSTLIEAKAKTLEVTNFLKDGKEQSPDWWKNV